MSLLFFRMAATASKARAYKPSLLSPSSRRPPNQLPTTTMTFSTLRALQAAIGAAIDDIERVYHERSQGNTLEYPSLDEPYYHTAEHTPEEELAEALKDDPAVVAASTRIVAACGQLATTVNKPFFGLMENLLRVRSQAGSCACSNCGPSCFIGPVHLCHPVPRSGQHRRDPA